jgi:serine protease AprX
MLEADPTLTPAQIREGLVSTAQPLRGAPKSRQGAGLLRPRLAAEWAERRRKA